MDFRCSGPCWNVCTPRRRRPTRWLLTALLLLLVPAGSVACASRGPVLAASGRLVEPDSMRELAAERRPHSHGLLDQRTLDSGNLVEARAQMRRRVTLDRLLAMAATAHPEMRRVKAELIAAEARRNQAGALPNPSVLLEARRLPVSAGTSFVDTNWRLWVRQPLPVTGRESARRESTEHARRAALERALSTGLDLELAVRLGFVDYWAAYRAHEEITRAVELRDELFAAMQEAQTAGEVAELEVLRAESELAHTRIKLSESAQDLAQAREALRTAVGDGTLPLGPPPERWAWGESQRLERRWPEPRRDWAVQHPRVRALAHEAEAKKRDPGEHGRYERDVSMRLGYEYQGSERRHWLNAGLELTLPFFDRGSHAERAVAALSQAELSKRENEIVGLLARLGRLRETYQVASERLAAYDESLLPAASKQRDAYKALYEQAARDEADDPDEQPLYRKRIEAEATLHELRASAWQARGTLARLHEELMLLTLTQRDQ